MSDTKSVASNKGEEDSKEKRRERIRARNQEIRDRNSRIVASRHYDAQRWCAKKSEVGKVDLNNFKNRYHWTTEYEEYAVDALVGPWDLHEQYRDEKKRRGIEVQLIRQPNISMLSAPTIPGMRAEHLNRDLHQITKGKNHAALDVDVSEAYIHRIRINSVPVLGYVTELMDITSGREWPRTFVRPFMTLVYIQRHMKNCLAELEKKFANAEVDTSQHEQDATERKLAVAGEADISEGLAAGAQHTTTDLDQTLPQAQDADLSTRGGDLQINVNQDTKGDAEANNTSDAEEEIASIYTTELESIKYDIEEENREIEQLMDSAEAFRDMRCYVNFMEKEIMPHFDFLRGGQAEKVIFDDLWYVFRPGDLIYSKGMGPSGDPGEELWRLYRVEIPEFTTSWDHVGTQKDVNGQYRVQEKVILSCYRIDHDGSTYGAVRQKFYIPYFPGRKDIRRLAVYPLRFVKNSGTVVEALRSQGQKFQNSFTQRHQSYQNWTVHMQGGSWSSSSSKASPEFIEGHVIVDFEETFKKMPDWRPAFHHPATDKDTSALSKEVNDDWDLKFSQDKSDKTPSPLAWASDRVVQDHAILLFQRRNLFFEDAFWQQQSKGSRFDTYDPPEQAITIKDNDLVLLPKRSFAYTLRERKFVAVDINHLRPVPIDTGIFDSLKISRDYKDLLRGLVTSHFQKRELERLYASRSIEGLSQDLVRGKGKGLVCKLSTFANLFLGHILTSDHF